MTHPDSPIAPGQVFAFECGIAGEPHSTIVNATSRGKAKLAFFRCLDGAWPFTAIRVRKAGGPHTSEAFLRTARYRGMPYLRCGDQVLVGDVPGVVVGHNASANFDVLFPEASIYKGNVLNVHPGGLKVMPARALAEQQ